MNLKEDSQIHMNNAEVVTVAFTPARFFGGNLEKSRKFLSEGKYILQCLVRVVYADDCMQFLKSFGNILLNRTQLKLIRKNSKLEL